MRQLKAFVKTFLGIPAVVISFYFIFKIISENRQTVYPLFSSIKIESLVAGTVFLSLYLLLRGIGWGQILKKNGYNMEFFDSIYYFSVSELKRYVPANIVSYVARISKFKEFGIPAKIVLISLAVESSMIVLSSLILGIFSADLLRRTTFGIPSLAFIIIYILLLLTFIIILCAVAIRRKINPLDYIDILFIYILGWVFFGAGNFLVLSSFAYVDPNSFLKFVSFFVLSWFIGYVSFIAPMGLGIREGVLAYGLSSFFPISLSFSLAILLRIMLVFSELIFLGALFIVRIFKKPLVLLLKKIQDRQMIILFLLIFSYIVYFIFLTFEKHQNFFTGRFDLGNMDQTVWNTINGRIFVLTDPNGTGIISRLAVHADFILVLISPFYIIWQDPRMLLLLQTVILGFGALFVYLLAVRVVDNRKLSLVFAISYLLNPLLQKQNLFDFHAVSLATTFLLAAFYFLFLRKNIYFLLFALLSALTKENVYLTIGLFGIYIFLRESTLFQNLSGLPNKKMSLIHAFSGRGLLHRVKREIFGKRYSVFLILSLLSFTAFYLLVAKFIPHARGNNHFALSYFSDFGDSPGKVATSIFLNPHKTLMLLFSPASLDYVKKIFMPVGFLSIFSPLYLIFAFSDMLINILSNNKNLMSIDFHYAATILPFVYISAIFAVKKILSFKIKFINRTTIFYYLMFFSILSTLSYGVLPGSVNPALEVFVSPKNNNGEIRNFLSQIPGKLSVAATNNLGAHLSHRQYIYTIPNGLDKADVIIFLLSDQFAQPSLKVQKEMAKQLEGNLSYVEIYRNEVFEAFARRDVAYTYFNTAYLR